MLDEKQIEQNYNNLILFIENNFNDEREEKLIKLYTDLADRIAIAPASNKANYHSCFIGGYVHHVLNVIDCATKISNLWKTLGGVESYTDEELKFVALNHDLGKIGNLDEEYYIPTDEQWKIKRGQLFDFNPKLQYMAHDERSIFLLQSYGIKINELEYLGIRLHDGLYSEGNKGYFINYDPHFELRSRLPYVIHWADMMASKLEYEQWRYSSDGIRFLESSTGSNSTVSLNKKIVKKKKPEYKLEVFNEDSGNSDVSSFEDLFGIADDSKTKE